MEFFSAFAASVVSAGTSLCACNCFYCRTSGTEKTGLSGNSSAVGRKSHKGKLFPAFVGKKTVTFIMQGTFCTADFPFSGWAAGLDPERRLFLAFWTGRKWDFCCVGLPVFWNMAVMEQKWLEKRNALGTQEEYAGTIFLAICIFLLFIGWQNFYVENSLTRALAKVGKDYSMLIYVLHYAVLQALSRCFKGRRSLLAMGYQQYGMMFVFAVTVVMVAVYVNARACLKNHSRKL